MNKRHLALLALQTEVIYIVAIDPLHTQPWPPPGHENLLKKLGDAAGVSTTGSLKETYQQCMKALLSEIEREDV
jgi:hypothetical protein